MLQRSNPLKTPDEKGHETEALLTQAEDNKFEGEELVGKYVRTDNRAYDFHAFGKNKNFLLSIPGLLVEDVLMQPSDIIEIPFNKAWYNGFATFVKLSEDSFNNLKTTLENKTGVWKDDSIFDGKWFTDKEYNIKKSRKYSSNAARAVHGLGGSSRKSKRIHRKPTKRRRNRRGNRKTKKN